MNDTAQTTVGTTTITTPTDREIVIERVFHAPRSRVFAALTEAELIERWWGRAASTTIVGRLEPRAGGVWRFVERGPDGSEHAFRGVFREVSPPERIVYTFEWEGMPGHVAIDAVSLEEVGESTKVTIRSLFHTTAERDGMIEAGMEDGLNESYAALERLLAEAGAASE